MSYGEGDTASYGEGDTAWTPHICELTHRAARIEELRQNLCAVRVENADLRVLMQLLNENPQLYMLYLRSTNAGRKVLASPLASSATSLSAASPSSASPSSSVTSFAASTYSSAASTTSSSAAAASTASSAAASTDVSVVSSSSSVNAGYWATPTTSPGVTGLFSRSVSSFAGSSPTSRTSENTRQDTGPSDTPTDVNTQTPKGHEPDTEGTKMNCSMLDQACPRRQCTRTTVIPSKRVLGEIAYQLERRILGFIFSRLPKTDSGDRSICRFYGYSVRSIRTLIRQEYTKSDGSWDDDTKLKLKNRLRDIMVSLGPLGYKLDEHGRFAQVMINRHGVFRRGSDSKKIEAFCLDHPETLRKFISLHARDYEEIKNMNILLECLLFFSNNDGMPVCNL